MKYLKHDNFQKHNNEYNWKQGCEHCKKPFEEDEKFVRIDVLESWFRGEDDVFCFHKTCLEKGLQELNNK